VLRFGVGSGRIRRLALLAVALVAACTAWLIGTHSVGRATSGGDPYSTPPVVNTNTAPHVVETTLTAENAKVDIGNGVMANAQTFNGQIPGPTFFLHVGDSVIVHFQNNLNVATGIHWHGIELSNEMDGTPFTQNAVPPGSSFIYKFTVDRPGVFWYHPHHFNSTNQVFRGLYGMIVVTDPNEAALQANGTLPPASQTKQLVLGDTTVCKAALSNPAVNYVDPDPQTGKPRSWVGGGALPVQMGPNPQTLCETTPIDDSGNTKPTAYNAGDIPAIQQNNGARTNEGNTVLTNGKNVGDRAGSPAMPDILAPGASTLDVRPGQGIRLQLVNAAAVRYFRLHLTTSTGVDIPLIRVGGEGGLLDNAVEEGGTQGTWVTGFSTGEILIPPGGRADVVAAIPASATGVATLWTEDYQRTGPNSPGNWSDIPTVPVMHLNVTGSAQNPAYSISAGTPLRAATGDPVPSLGAPTGALLNPATFSPPKLGLASPAITFTQAGTSIGVNGTSAPHDVPDYQTATHLNSTRYAKIGDVLQLSVTNTTQAHHPFHLHGFSLQPVSLSNGAQTFTWPYNEFRDTVDIPPGFTLVFKIKITDRPKADGVTMGGALGRWLFHCHIFFHAELGMLSELVVTSPTGKERPDIDVNSGTVQVNQNQTATVSGRYFNVDGGPVTLSSSVGTMHDDGGNAFTWTFPTGAAASQVVFLTATNASGLKGQIPFFLQIKNLGPPTLTLPGAQTAKVGSTLTFGISASTPNTGLPLALGASGLPTSLVFTDKHNNTGTVAGKVTARPGTYTATFTASDGTSNKPTSGTVKITITPGPPPPLRAVIGKKVRLSKTGAITVTCVVSAKSIQTCSATAFSGRKKVGSGSARQRKTGKLSLAVNVTFNAATRRKINRSKNGVKLTINIVAKKFGSGQKFRASAITTVLPAKKKH
jgi:FtsP/CotA-like multicopper oxidase with cupredoxin domain